MEGNKNQLWFKRKRYGWGWVPSAWQGWMIMLLYFLALFSNFKTLDLVKESGGNTLLIFAPRFIILTIILLVICYKKGEKPKWSWGK